MAEQAVPQNDQLTNTEKQFVILCFTKQCDALVENASFDQKITDEELNRMNTDFAVTLDKLRKLLANV